ncbi:MULTISPECIES: hypothetical protein [Spirulina sp. CCY15215]|uniref:hypothetical protein n=1 Tax=Spirulina sp. CCY15215 TaxID=2767591 RepID=UPI00194EEC2E|nr:hypothetical protein [Spirulina major]
MSEKKTPDLLSKFAGLLTIIGGALYFTGWIYRWAYFSFFQLEITTLDFPHQSFLFVPLQVFFGSFATWDSLKQIALSLLLFLLVIYLGIPFTLWLIEKISIRISHIFNFIKQTLQNKHQQLKNYLTQNRPLARKNARKRFLVAQLRNILTLLINILKPLKFQPIDYKKSLWDETIIIFWILILLFLLARNQGIVDARRDAGKDSKLPSITLIVPENTLAFGNTPDNPQTLKGFQIIGDAKRYANIQNTPINDPDRDRVWRLLLDSEGFFYLFKSLPENATLEQRPILFIIQGSFNGSSLVILSPSPAK